MTLRLDRMAVEEAGANAARLAMAIHAQLGPATGPVPVEAIAYALDIREIRVEALTNLEGALITQAERSIGSILVNRSRPTRERFTIAHELAHFLCPHHVPTDTLGFRCEASDLTARTAREHDRHLRQEVEANTFAIELLAPRSRTRRYCASHPDLGQARAMADALTISVEAAVRRYVEHHAESLAVVFSRDGRVRYSILGNGFPRLGLHKDGPLPLPLKVAPFLASDIEDADPSHWLQQPDRVALAVQSLTLGGGFGVTLLHALEGEEDEEEDAVESLTSRFGRFSR